MTDQEIQYLKQRWVLQRVQLLGNVHMAGIGFKVLDLRKEGVMVVEAASDRSVELNYLLNDKIIELSSPVNPANALRMEIIKLTSDKLVMALSGRKGVGMDQTSSEPVAELHYSQADEGGSPLENKPGRM